MSKYRILFYTARFEEEPPTNVINFNCLYGTDICDLKVCGFTGVMYILQSLNNQTYQLYAISTDNHVSAVKFVPHFFSHIKCFAVTVNGDLLLCIYQDQISLHMPNGNLFSEIMTIMCTVTTMLNLPKQQIALMDAYTGTIVVLDV